MIDFTVDREEFAGKRRKSQTDLEAALRPFVQEAIDPEQDTGPWDELLEAVESLYGQQYTAEGGEGEAPALKLAEVREALQQTTSPRNEKVTEDRITVWLATWILSQATMAATQTDPEDLFLEWVTMHDSAVREAHGKTDGQVRPIGESFDVDGTEMPYPGWPGAPIELWINCRCTLRPTLAEEALVAASFKDYDAAERKKAHTLPDGSFPIEDCQDLRNAIQAIGRAKDPAKAKRHIRTQKSRLGCPEVEIPDTWALSDYSESETEEAPMPDDQQPEETGTADASAPGPIPFYTVLAPEGIPSGDKRKFSNGALRTRPLPLPMTWQKATAGGHDGGVTVARIDRAVRVPIDEGTSEIRAIGMFLTTAEADEVIGLIADFGQYGVSVDADDTAFELDEEEGMVEFTDSRVSGASIVSIPAFHQAFIRIGEPPEGFMDGEDLESEGGSLMDEEALAAALSFDAEEVFKDLAPGKTEDGPGWLTHPVDTDRLRDYWVRGPGAAKINWGVPGDFNRCRIAVAEYVKPQYLNGYCANRHYDALGFWPGRPVSGDTDVFAEREGEPAEAISLVASEGQIIMPADWFTMEEPDELTHLTVTEEGQVFGHVAGWKQCHGTFMDTCVVPPKSYTDYSHYATGHVLTDAGPVRTGRITVGTEGHAANRLSMRQAKEHYDKTGNAVADVAVRDGKHGIWVCGAIRPDATPEQVYALRASDVSGDWRQPGWGQEKEMIAVLAVNRGGFNIPRVAAAVRDGQVTSLVAAGMIYGDEPETKVDDSVERMAMLLAEQVATALENRQKRRERMAELAASLEGAN